MLPGRRTHSATTHAKLPVDRGSAGNNAKAGKALTKVRLMHSINTLRVEQLQFESLGRIRTVGTFYFYQHLSNSLPVA